MNENRADSNAFQELAGELIASGYGFRFQAHGRSMLPTIEDGDFLQLQPVDPVKLKVGDIVLFRAEGKLKAHRIVRQQGTRITTRGDASLGPDDELTRDQILGRIIAKQSRSTGRLTPLNSVSERIRCIIHSLRGRLAL